MRKQYGVTLTELLITIAIVAILVTVVVPSVRDLIIQQRIIAELNELSGLVQLARSQAIDQHVSITLCPSKDHSRCSSNWNHGKILFNDADGNRVRSESEELLHAVKHISKYNLLSGPKNNIVFRQAGDIASPATLLLCDKDNNAEFARALTISLQGRVKLSQDTNNDGIYEDNAGNALECT
ncbi:GspH/FimT family pseudopilin [Aestuariibacter salexigens]|uniref:GspH/FimT family pseudopilin n=1 Tax=Aestuariibacter salexigens TaxID=226010 RepID=UPI00040E4B4F|nr:GspH/FimT family pseudopilin [Aestuariibacter salexigens]